MAYLGLTLSLRTISFIICIPGFVLLSRQLKKEERNGIHGALANGGAELEALRKEDFVISNLDQSQQASDSSTDRETQLWLCPHTENAGRCGDTHTQMRVAGNHTLTGPLLEGRNSTTEPLECVNLTVCSLNVSAGFVFVSWSRTIIFCFNGGTWVRSGGKCDQQNSENQHFSQLPYQPWAHGLFPSCSQWADEKVRSWNERGRGGCVFQCRGQPQACCRGSGQLF